MAKEQKKVVKKAEKEVKNKKIQKVTKEGTAKPKAVKKKKDANAPKKGMTAFLHFSSDNRLKVKKENPDKPHKEIISLLGSMWGKMTQAQKKPYEDKAQQDKNRYTKEKEAYEKTKAKSVEKKTPSKKN